ncbi:MAG TPA: hypothetical protein VGY58_24045, partial [Gemmataceae bacterium]|nr:hypothetical protein [Gemmataceae bacterium]
MMRHITGMAAMLFLTAPVLAGEMDEEFAGKTSRGPALAEQTVFTSAAKTPGTLQTSSKATELDAESHIQAARGGGGGHGGGGHGGGGHGG